jgi:hypothetical protein
LIAHRVSRGQALLQLGENHLRPGLAIAGWSGSGRRTERQGTRPRCEEQLVACPDKLLSAVDRSRK